MAAETVQAAKALETAATHGKGMAGNMKVAYESYTISAAVEAGDKFQMLKLPAGATIIGGYFRGEDLDTGTEELNMDIGWAANGGSGTYDAADPNGLADLGVITGDAFAAGNVANVVSYNYPFNGLLNTGVFPTFTEETTLEITVVAAAATFAAGTVSLCVFYTMD
ncbi:MAG: hypothetical protein GY800_09015 [Planctomycetes bacterium]|nr:hypothetical protein [Planctomycetota bacterium]